MQNECSLKSMIMLILIIRMNNFKILFQSFSAIQHRWRLSRLGARAQLLLLLLILIYVKKVLRTINGRARKIYLKCLLNICRTLFWGLVINCTKIRIKKSNCTTLFKAKNFIWNAYFKTFYNLKKEKERQTESWLFILNYFSI